MYLHPLHHQLVNTNAQEHKDKLYPMIWKKRMLKLRPHQELAYLQLGNLYEWRDSHIEGGFISKMALHEYIPSASCWHHRCCFVWRKWQQWTGILIASHGILVDNGLKCLSHYQIHCGVDHIEIYEGSGKNYAAEFHLEKHKEFASVLWIKVLQKKNRILTDSFDKVNMCQNLRTCHSFIIIITTTITVTITITIS